MFPPQTTESWTGAGICGIGIEREGWSWAGLQGLGRLLPLLLERLCMCMCWGGAVNGGFFTFWDGLNILPPPPNETGFPGLWKNLVWVLGWGWGYFPAGIALWCLGIRLNSRNLLDP